MPGNRPGPGLGAAGSFAADGAAVEARDGVEPLLVELLEFDADADAGMACVLCDVAAVPDDEAGPGG